MKQEKIYIYGKHALEEAVKNTPQAVSRVFLENRKDTGLIALLEKAKIPFGDFSGGATGGLEKGAKHQGVVARLTIEKLVRPYGEFIKDFKATPDSALALLGEIEDPHNVGAIIRSAAAFGLSGVLIPEHNQAQITGAVIKVSAGMAFRVPLVSIGNVNSTIRDLKEKGFWIYGLAGEGKTVLGEEKFDAPAVFILGNEGQGIRAETRNVCDALLKIPMHPRAESLNVAASAAVAFYAWGIKHFKALKKN